jgi:hypothetical protein
MKGSQRFKVSFGRIGRTIICADEAGTICFTFDMSPAESAVKEKWNLHLDSRPLVMVGQTLEYASVTDRDRVEAALLEAKAYAAAKGYLVVSR